ncbi:signal transduction histidine kinase [Kibdelosporangium banguiense]|uniref:Signal transduction histidine kinase n=1 Tax=Kibdelosporangium banguiense TaxID=1365924 RepID=A0ABS4TRB3_9PSEU|nr:GAF domain-containing sensor histidine kinase [Kibdelosporangium banguiense]MBP2326953.1 signal transduction histidine kinase [Kibdelosporangium banguiense]
MPAQHEPADLGWGDSAIEAPDGLAVVDRDGLFVRVNLVGSRLLGQPEAELIGSQAPFSLVSDTVAEPAGLFDDGPGEQVLTWTPASGMRREIAYRVRHLPRDRGLAVVTFRDVTEERHRQRRIAALARSAANLASHGSVSATLDALAREVLQTDALAAVQVLAVDDSGRGLQVMGTAGFRHWDGFFERLLECRDRGASLRMLEALETRKPVVVANRWNEIQHDPAWIPLRDYMGEISWDSFASVPLITRGRCAGVLNAYFAPGQVVGGRTLEFLIAMSEQAAIAIDYAALMQRERDTVRREERQRLARDLHDSIVQQIFSVSMQAKAMEVLAGRGEPVAAEAVHRMAAEVGQLSQTALTDLRAMVHELRPTATTERGGLEESVRALVESTTNRTGLQFTMHLGHRLDTVCGDLAEDVYRIVAEAIHNVVKHAEAGQVVIRLDVRGKRLHATISDNGRGLHPETTAIPASPGYGLKSMQQRAERWGGTLTVQPGAEAGTMVRFTIPLTAGIPVRENTTVLEINLERA